MTRAGLPSLAWVLRVGRSGAEIVCGEQVAEISDGVFEGSWVGASGSAGIIASTTTFGSGMLIDGDGLRLVPPSHHLEGIYVYQRAGVTFASNSLVGVLEAADINLLPDVDYPLLFAQSCDGKFRFTVPTTGSAVLVVLYDGLRIEADGSLRDVPKPRESAFVDYADYRRRLDEALASVVANAPDYELVATMSSGYDSASMATVARQFGCRRAVTIAEGKPVRGAISRSDSGERTAKVLGLDIETFDRLAYRRRDDLPEAEFLATGMSGEDVVFLSMAARLERTILVTGFFGDGMWWSHRPKRPLFWRLEQAGQSLTEFRLRSGFIHVPLPWFGASQMPSVATITRSPEMEPWVLRMDNDRPIPRRILEDAGVPRGTFADAKRATSASIHADGPAALAPSTRSSLDGFAAEQGTTVSFRPRRFPKWRRRLYSRSRRLKLRTLAEWLEGPRRNVVRHPPAFGNLLLRWAVEAIAPRYRAAREAFGENH